jgi:alpha-mannosidase
MKSTVNLKISRWAWQGAFIPALLLGCCLSAATGHAQGSGPVAEHPDLSKQPTLYVVGYAHLDTEWRWEYPQVVDEYIRKTMEDNFKLFEKYPHYVFNFSGANRYRLIKEYYPEDYAKLQKYVAAGNWFPAGSSMEEGDVNAPNGEAIIRQVLYGNNYFRKELGKSSMEFMLPDCFGFPSSLPAILAHAGVRGFSTQKLSWGSGSYVGGPQSIENTPTGTPFNVGMWIGPDGSKVIAAFNPGSYGGHVTTDLSQPLPPEPPSPLVKDLEKQLADIQQKSQESGQRPDAAQMQEYYALSAELDALNRSRQDRERRRFQNDWAARVLANGKATGVFADYHYVGTGDIGGAPEEPSVKRLEAIVTKGTATFPDERGMRGEASKAEPVKVGEGPVHVVSAPADQMFLDITDEQAAKLPRYTGELELTNHSAGSLTSQAYMKRWIRKHELLADAAEKSSVAAAWLGARPYPLDRLNDAWTLAMGAHFHDIASGTATPRAYEFAWNDAVIGLNQFSGVLKDATEAVAAGMNTETKGVPVVVYNPLNIAREDLVEASINLPAGTTAVNVTAPDGKQVPAQLSNGKVIFTANVPSVGYVVYDVQPGAAAAEASSLRVAQNELENAYYHVQLNADGDISSVFDKTANQELLAAPARLAISYDNPAQWPAWNMDWEQEQAAPREYVSGPVKVRIAENGAARVALEVSRETAGSRFVQTISLSAGDAGKRVEIANVIDWNTRESNLKATFPLTAVNSIATYNWDIGTIQRPSADPNKFEVPSHQWIDQTDMSGKFGATILTDCKNGSDKPNDKMLRLTLLRTPGVAGGYPDEATQEIGHHEFVYGISGHAGDYREAQTDWQAQRLNDPLLAFETTKHDGALGKSFSLLQVSNPRIRVLALKKAELSDEVIIRLVELDGKEQKSVRVSFAAPVAAAREVNGQEQAVGTADVAAGALVATFGAFQPRTFALRLAAAPTTVAAVKSEPVALTYDVATASTDNSKQAVGFDGKGNSLPAEMLPSEIDFNSVKFHLAKAATGTPNAVIAKGQVINLPATHANRVYLIAASADGDQKVTFEVGGKKVDLNIQNWGGFIGQWDDRTWSSKNVIGDNYGEMTGLKPGFIKRADLAWYCSHHHNAAGQNAMYEYSYLFAYSMELPSGAKSIKLPKNDKIRILAISVADENPQATPAQPLYDVLPAAHQGTPDFVVSASSDPISIAQGRSASARALVLPRGNFNGKVELTASGLPQGVTATFSAFTSGTSTVQLAASATAPASEGIVTVTAKSGEIAHSFTVPVKVTAVLTGTIPVDLSAVANEIGIYNDGSKFAMNAGLDGDGSAISKEAIGNEQLGGDVIFKLGAANVRNVVTNAKVNLPAGKYDCLKVLATGVNGNQPLQTFVVNYTDGTSKSFQQGVSDWSNPGHLEGEAGPVKMDYRINADGSQDGSAFYARTYTFALDKNKEVSSISLPANREVLVLAMTLVPVQK